MRKPGPVPGFSFSGICPERLLHFHLEFIHPFAISRCAMTPETEGKEEKGSSGVPFVNDPGNEDPGSLMDDALVPLIDDEDAEQEEEEKSQD